MQTKKSKKKDLKKLGFLGGDVSKGTCNFVLQDEEKIHHAAGSAYNQYQKCGLKGAKRLFKTGW